MMATPAGNDNSGTAVNNSILTVELLCFLVLALITIFRKELSSNDGYRKVLKVNASTAANEESPSLKTRNVVEEASIGKLSSNSTSSLETSPTSSICLSRILSDENLMLNVYVYLCDSDIKRVALLSKTLLSESTSDFIWEQLWILTFGPMWHEKSFCEIRKMRGIAWSYSSDRQEVGNLNAECTECTTAYKGSKTYQKPLQGWFYFYLEFEICWMDWLLAGCCTEDYCLIGLHGSLYDITNFLSEHPGSPESLTEASGGDGTDIFSDIGHSSFANSLADLFLLWGIGKKRKLGQAKQQRLPFIPKQNSQDKPNRYQVKMKRDRFFAEKLILRDNYAVKAVFDEVQNQKVGARTHVIEDTPFQAEIIPGENATSSSLPAVVSQSSENTGTWPLGVNLHFNMNTLCLPLSLDSLSSSVSLQKSVSSITESVLLAQAKAAKFLRRGLGGARLRDRTSSKSMAPTLFDKKMRCLSGCKHSGRLRMLYDPLELQWWGWWTCCGMGELALDIREEDRLCAEIADQNMAFKIC